jgi:hypothetical protein
VAVSTDKCRKVKKLLIPSASSYMTLPTETASPAPVLHVSTVPTIDHRHVPCAFDPIRPSDPWNRTTLLALLALVCIWIWKVYSTWAAWGDLTIDSGHEMYVPLLLAEGKQLYRDTFFSFGPPAPYFNSYLFRLFGIQLNVLYWAGSLSALGSAILLYLTGMRLSSWIMGWTAGAVVMMEAFHPSLFCFPLPYSFAAVYGCLVGCLFVLLVITASASVRSSWIFAAGSAAAAALLIKPEYGIACYGTLGVLVALRYFSGRSWRLLRNDVLAILPGILTCCLVIGWMVSIAGVDFITHENILSWPTSYFMKTYGKVWLARSGFTVSAPAFAEALFRAIPIVCIGLLMYCRLWRKLTKILLVLLVILCLTMQHFFQLPFLQATEQTLSAVFFPQDMVLYIIVATFVAWCYFWRDTRAIAAPNPAIPLLLVFSSLLAFRILMKMAPSGYPIYYNGPVALSFLMLLCLFIRRCGRSRQFVFWGELAVCLACLTPVAIRARAFEAAAKDFVPLTTSRGTVRAPKHLAERYQAAIRFMKEKAALGESVLCVPEDTSLYFLSETHSPTRLYAFVPGVLAPGKMTDETIREIERQPVRYVLWSNRIFPEYGAPIFGVNFDRTLGDYLKSHYRSVGPLTPDFVIFGDWTAVVWERNPKLN